jgi:hypothetical protein
LHSIVGDILTNGVGPTQSLMRHKYNVALW